MSPPNTWSHDWRVDPLGTILSIWAHPDDETFLAGALMARAAAAGSRVVCATATRGEQGSPDPRRWPPGPPLAAVRTEELAAALGELGVREHIWLDYPDGGCGEVDEDEAASKLAEIMEEIRPDTVLTFGPDGMTGHIDHKAVSRWAIAAAHRVRLSPTALHFATNTPAFVAEFRQFMDDFGVMMDDGELPVTSRDELSIYVAADGELLSQKVRALAHQQSQIASLMQRVGEKRFRELVSEEAFRLARVDGS
jgi:LmbE family N-acetylglucosaminyl deacetylase